MCTIRAGVRAVQKQYLYRWLTTRIPEEKLFRIIQWYVPGWLPIDRWIKRILGVRPYLRNDHFCWNYHYLPLSREQQIEWVILDTFDALASTYDQPQTLESVRQWFHDAGLINVHVRLGGNGVPGNGQTPAV